ncbi:hypothetical protein E2C01_090476 [Portunus trituberculatus]|uniref:Uncharacterized protein n=1 Tax=Portunus trituberculatus TaxID=210409 RepID=A0A5B7JSJ8_PORTR|nr:hypothetical protein [Portunus trituberculatus]
MGPRESNFGTVAGLHETVTWRVHETVVWKVHETVTWKGRRRGGERASLASASAIIRFTVEPEANYKLPFLDTVIHCYCSGVSLCRGRVACSSPLVQL